jgi:TPR repeat protein
MADLMKFTVPAIAEVIRSLGYKGKPFYGEAFAGVESAANGRGFIVCPLLSESANVMDEQAEGTLVRFRACWMGMDNLDEHQADDLCSWFNSNQPFAKMYRTASKMTYDLWLEADLYVLDGMTESSFQNRVEAFIKAYEYAMRCLDRCSYKDKDAIIERHNKAIEMFDAPSEDMSDAVHLYRINAHLGFAGSQNNFGDLFELGKHVQKDDIFAMYWYTRASERGEPTAYFSLATMLLDKSRDNMDALILAAQYAILAAEELPDGKNRFTAIETRETLRSLLDEDQFKLAEAHAKNFKPLYKEKWTLTDSPGPSVTVVQGSGTLN